MTLPTWDQLMMPSLQNSKEEIRVLDLAEICAKNLNLTEEEKNLTNAKDQNKKYITRTWWAVTYLVQAKLLDKVRRGVVKITERGQGVLNSGIQKIDTKFLEQYKEYQDFVKRSNKKIRFRSTT